MIKNQQQRQTAGSETGVQGLQISEPQIYLEESGGWPSFRLWRGAWAGTGWEWEKGFGWEGMKLRAGWVMVVGWGEWAIHIPSAKETWSHIPKSCPKQTGPSRGMPSSHMLQKRPHHQSRQWLDPELKVSHYAPTWLFQLLKF